MVVARFSLFGKLDPNPSQPAAFATTFAERRGNPDVEIGTLCPDSTTILSEDKRHTETDPAQSKGARAAVMLSHAPLQRASWRDP